MKNANSLISKFHLKNLLIFILILYFCLPAFSKKNTVIENKISSLLSKMTLKEKIGQMNLQNWGHHEFDNIKNLIRSGQLGGLLNLTDLNIINQLQHIAVKESPSGIPLIIGRDVIHGFKTIFPIPLGMSASWNPELIKKCARISAQEASAYGVNWTFAPMIDISRDPRWGRIAESPGEDPYLASIFAKAMIKGFQGNDLSDKDTIAACAKHFAGYGAAEAGRDYNTTRIPEQYLRDVYLPPFKASVDANVATFMSAFNEINGIPASGNEFLCNRILRYEWGFDGIMVSDWTSLSEMIEHGYSANRKQAAYAGVNAGVDMDMESDVYADHLEKLVSKNKKLHNI